ncbi:MAG: glutathione S-transferase [Candidatus Synechococcus spongiarum SP3]|uniref:Glutathione S-transferase n=1 Tax=Candidatus Synechococcus spongiarum SP3 TaxID=1604020 RepID=A0A0G2J447_9SYNE|nr:MAG: glutathione S-transferase [Candidatus Synechococcus spongiarum SP3]
MTELVFYTNPMSRGRIVRWMLEEMGIDYTTRIIAYGPEMQGPRYRAVNPMAKVPAIRHGEIIVTEAAAICTYLADAFPATDLAPKPGTPERGPFYRWLFFGAGPMEQAMANAGLGWTAGSPQAEASLGYGTMERVCRTLDELLSDGRSYILGEQFSAADVYVGAQIIWGLEFKTMDKRPSFSNYVERLTARPAMVRAQALDDHLVEKAEGSQQKTEA